MTLGAFVRAKRAREEGAGAGLGWGTSRDGSASRSHTGLAPLLIVPCATACYVTPFFWGGALRDETNIALDLETTLAWATVQF